MKKIFDFFNTITFKSLIMSFLSTLCLPYVLKVEPVSISNSILLVVIWWCFFSVIKNSLKEREKSYLGFSFAMGCIYSFLLYIGKNCEMYGNFDISLLGLGKIIFITIGFSFILMAFIEMICRTFIDKKVFECIENVKSFFEYDNKYFFKIWFLIMLCWLPFWILMWPAVFSYDLPVQIPEAVSGNYTNWHPVLYTISTYYSLLVGLKYFGSCEIGCAICILPQFVIMSAICAYCINVFAKHSVSKFIKVLTFAFFAFYPVTLFFIVSITKDVLFSGSILLLSTLLFDASFDNAAFLQSNKKVFMVMIAILGILFFRTNGIFVIILSIPFIFMFFGRKKGSIKLFLSFMIPAGFYLWLALYGFQLFNVAPTRPEEAISVPMQQYTRVLRYHSAEVEGKSLFFEIFPDDALDRYKHLTSDYLKFNIYTDWKKRLFNREKYVQNRDKCREIWLNTGIQYPDEYLKAFLCLNMPFWYPDYKYHWDNHSSNPYFSFYNIPETIEGFGVKQRAYWITKFMYRTLYNLNSKSQERPLYDKVFPLAVLFSTGFPFWILIFSFAFAVFRKKSEFLLPLVIPIATIFVYLFSPTYLLRYNYGVIICIPIMLAVIGLASFCKNRDV